jgi:hypothetical protein
MNGMIPMSGSLAWSARADSNNRNSLLDPRNSLHRFRKFPDPIIREFSSNSLTLRD